MTNGQRTQIKEQLWAYPQLWRFRIICHREGNFVIKSPSVTIGHIEVNGNNVTIVDDSNTVDADYQQQRQQLERVMKITRAVLEKRLVMERRA